MKNVLKTIITSVLMIISNQIISQNTDKLSPEFHKKRRSVLRSKMPKNSVAVFFSNTIRNRSNDVDYIYHQDPNFYYLTGFREHGAVLAVFSEDQKDSNGNSFNETLYVRKKDASYELWNGEMLGKEKAEKNLKINSETTMSFFMSPPKFKSFNKVFVYNIEKPTKKDYKKAFTFHNLKEKFKLTANFDAKLSGVKRKFYRSIKKIPLNRTEELINKVNQGIAMYPELRNDSIAVAFKSSKKMIDYAKVMKRLTNKLNYKSNIDISFLNRTLAKMREVKTEEELKFLKKAILISAIGQIEMMKAMKPHISEREIQGVHEFVYKKYGAEYEGYPSIVGAANNGCVLHYIKNEKKHAENGELVLMDLGAEYRGYTADVTRTIPTNGKFSKEQKAIYDIVLKAQTEGINACKVGGFFAAPGNIARKVINDGLAKLGIIESPSAYHKYFPHGTSHYLGLDVHDPGTYGYLKHNTVITVEPGIYIPEGSKCDKKWWGIAIRIEDDILITNDGPINLSARAPRKINEIEKMMQQKSVLKNWILPKLD